MLLQSVQDWIKSFAVLFFMVFELFFIRDFFILHFCLFFSNFWGRWRYIALVRLIIKFCIPKKTKRPIFLMLIVKFCICFVFKHRFLISRMFCVKIWGPTIECEFVWRWGWYCGRRRARIDGEKLALLTAVYIRVKFCLEMGDENWRRGRRARIAGNIEYSIYATSVWWQKMSEWVREKRLFLLLFIFLDAADDEKKKKRKRRTRRKRRRRRRSKGKRERKDYSVWLQSFFCLTWFL